MSYTAYHESCWGCSKDLEESSPNGFLYLKNATHPGPYCVKCFGDAFNIQELTKDIDELRTRIETLETNHVTN